MYIIKTFFILIAIATKIYCAALEFKQIKIEQSVNAIEKAIEKTDELQELIDAANKGPQAMLDLLIAKGLDSERNEKKDRSNEFIKALKDNKLIEAKELLAKGVDITLTDDLGSTPLNFAVTTGDTELVKRLIDMNADLNPINKISKHSAASKE